MASGLAAVDAGARSILLALGVVVAAACLLDWVVRTRRVNPFSRTSRFVRARIDPMMAPIERLVVRAGGVPTSAPLWTVIGYAVFAILAVTAIDFAGALVAQAAYGLQTPRALPWMLLSWVFALLKIALLVRVISSWLPISPYSVWIRWSYVLTEWLVAPLRRFIPTLGPIDITPVVAWLLLSLLQSLLSVP